MLEDLVLVGFGWLLGLLAPLVVDANRSWYRRRDLARAIRSEAEDVRVRLALASLHLRQMLQLIDREYLEWLQPILANYKGNEAVSGSLELIKAMLATPDDEFSKWLDSMKKDFSGVPMLKKYSASLVELSLPEVVHFPVDYQRAIYEFRNQLSILEQDIDFEGKRYWMTYDSSVSDENYNSLTTRYRERIEDLVLRIERVADCLTAIVNHPLGANSSFYTPIFAQRILRNDEP